MAVKPIKYDWRLFLCTITILVLANFALSPLPIVWRAILFSGMVGTLSFFAALFVSYWWRCLVSNQVYIWPKKTCCRSCGRTLFIWSRRHRIEYHVSSEVSSNLPIVVNVKAKMSGWVHVCCGGPEVHIPIEVEFTPNGCTISPGDEFTLYPDEALGVDLVPDDGVPHWSLN